MSDAAPAEPGGFYLGPDPDADPVDPPKQERRPRITRLRAKKDTDTPPAPKKERTPTPAGRRVSLAEMGTGIAKGLAMLSANAGYQGASRALILQSEAAGPAFDQAVRGTFIDRLAQPLARAGGNAKDLGALVALPISTEAYLQNPTPITQAAFRAALIGSLPQIARARKTAAKEQAKLEKDLAELAEMFGKEPGEHISLDEVAIWLMTGSTDGTVVPPAPPPNEPEPF